MTKRVSMHELGEYTDLLDASEVGSIIEHKSVVFTIARHPQLGEIVGVSTPHESFILTDGI